MHLEISENEVRAPWGPASEMYLELLGTVRFVGSASLACRGALWKWSSAARHQPRAEVLLPDHIMALRNAWQETGRENAFVLCSNPPLAP